MRCKFMNEPEVSRIYQLLIDVTDAYITANVWRHSLEYCLSRVQISTNNMWYVLKKKKNKETLKMQNH